MTSINKLNFSNTEQTETKNNQGVQKQENNNSVWNKYDTDGNGVFNKEDDLYKGIAKEVNHREKNNRDSKLTNALKDILNCVGESFEVVNQKIQDIYKGIYGEGNYEEESKQFMDTRADFANKTDKEAFSEY